MLLDKHYHKKKMVFLIMIIMLTYCFLPFFTSTDITEDKQIYIKPILASSYISNLSSFHPWTFYSGSGKFHMLFLHEILACDITVYDYYHTYELENGSWVSPKKIGQVPLIFNVEPTKNGFTIYFGQNIDYKGSQHGGYEESYLLAVFKMQYNENLDQWSDPEELFGDSHIRDYLKLSDQQISRYLHSFFLQRDGSLFVVWSFEFRGQDVNLTHKYMKTHILSEIDTNGVIDSHPISGLEGNYRKNRFVRIVEYDDSFYFYTQSYTKKAILFPNGTCSNWQDSLMPENLAKNLPLTTFADHRVQQYWEVWEGQTISVIGKRYLVYYPYKVGWQILDLTSENLTAKSFISPYNIIPVDFLGNSWIGHRTFGFEKNLYSIQEVFLTPIFTNSTIELWEFNYGNTSWRQISSLEYSPTNHFDYLGESPIIELIADDNSWRIFWNQEVRDGVTPLHEIFTVMYNSTADEWSIVTQVTNTGTITDDYDYCEPIPGLLFAFTMTGLFITVLFLKKYELNR
ncbi:MAG: hypothetical protein ACXADY_23855 [Candidatus Hodarchaeales archaeon]|jgi:hypothetical protein